MATSGNKPQFVQDIQILANLLAGGPGSVFPQGVIGAVNDLVGYYEANGWAAGGINPIVDADVQPYGLTAAQIANFMTFLEQLQNLATGQPVVASNYYATVQQIRTT